jgi:hypothetical protein
MANPRKGQPTIQPSGHNGWCTPPNLLTRIRQFAGGNIALDPCSNSHSMTAALLQFGKEQNGLERDWAAELEARQLSGLVYVNPPYDTQTLEKVALQCAKQAQMGLEIMALVPCKLDQQWWQETVFETVRSICFVRGRIKFWKEGRPTSGAPMPCAFLYWGKRKARFRRVFSVVGRVVSPGLSNAPSERRHR